MLDLSITNKSFMSVKMPDGKEVKVLPPKRKLMATLQGLGETEDIDQIYEAVALILSNNRDKKSFSIENVEDFDIGDIWKVMNSYTNFVNEIQKN